MRLRYILFVLGLAFLSGCQTIAVPSTLAEDPFNFKVARGGVDGFQPQFILGDNIGISNSFETIWSVGTRYQFLTTASTLDITSTSNDDDINGIGLRQVLVQGLDGDYNYQEEVLDMSGTSVVTTSLTYLRINNVLGINSGSSQTNIGVVDLVDGTNIQARIDVGDGRSRGIVYTIPANETWFVNRFIFNAGKGDEIEIRGEVTIFDFGTILILDKIFIFENTYSQDFELLVAIPAKSDIEFMAQRTSSGNSRIDGTIEHLRTTNEALTKWGIEHNDDMPILTSQQMAIQMLG